MGAVGLDDMFRSQSRDSVIVVSALGEDSVGMLPYCRHRIHARRVRPRQAGREERRDPTDTCLHFTPTTTSVELRMRPHIRHLVDSSVRDDHRSFIDAAGNKRIVAKIYFSGDDHLADDEYGHGTHVASLAAGGIGKPCGQSR